MRARTEDEGRRRLDRSVYLQTRMNPGSARAKPSSEGSKARPHAPSHALTVPPSRRLTVPPSHRLTVPPSHSLTVPPSHRPSTSVLLLLLALFCLNGCASAPHRRLNGRYGGTLELSGDDFHSLDPAIAYDVPGWGIERLLYTGLLDYDNHARLIPKGATRWTVSPDGKTYTFYLRHDVHFEGPLTHGRPVTSADYAYEIQRVLDPKTASPGFAFYNTIVGTDAFVSGKAKTVSGIDSREPYRLVIHLKQPSPAFLNIAAMPFAYAVPREVVEKYGAPGFTLHAEGSGPFMLGSWRRLVSIRLDRNPHYFDRRLPYLDHIHERFGIDPLNSMMMYETGELGISDIPTADFVRITHTPKYAPYIVKRAQIAIFYLSLNCEMPPFTDIRVRQAMNYAINRPRILQLINNQGIVAKSVLPPGMPGYDPKMQGYPYDPARARELLREAGYANGFDTVLWIPGDRSAEQNTRIAEGIQQDLKAVGVRLEIKSVTFAVLQDAVAREKTVPMSIDDWYQDFPDPSDFLDVLLNSKQARPTAGNNNAFYKSKAMDSLLNRAASMMNPAKRLDLYRQANRLALHDAPWVFLFYPMRYELRRPWVHGYQLHPVWTSEYEKIWLSPRGGA